MEHDMYMLGLILTHPTITCSTPWLTSFTAVVSIFWKSSKTMEYTLKNNASLDFMYNKIYFLSNVTGKLWDSQVNSK